MTSPDTVERRNMLDVLKEALVGADRVVIETPNALGEMDAHYLHAPEVAAALSAMPAQGVSVRPLKWVTPSPTTDGQWQDTTGIYDIEESILFIGHVETGIRFKTVKAAKAAAQADYERRILSALSPAPMPVAEAARVLLDEFPHGGWPSECFNAIVDHKENPDSALTAALRALTQEDQP